MVTIEFFLPLLSSVFGTRKSEFMFTLNEILNCIPNASSQGFFGFTYNMSLTASEILFKYAKCL